jgi:hypothetical protein
VGGFREAVEMIEPEKVMTAKVAVSLAVGYVMDIYSDNASVTDVLLEEIEFDETSATWNVTVSFRVTTSSATEPKGQTLTAALLGYSPKGRAYKVVGVDARTGEIRFMKIREMGRGNA